MSHHQLELEPAAGEPGSCGPRAVLSSRRGCRSPGSPVQGRLQLDLHARSLGELLGREGLLIFQTSREELTSAKARRKTPVGKHCEAIATKRLAAQLNLDSLQLRRAFNKSWRRALLLQLARLVLFHGLLRNGLRDLLRLLVPAAAAAHSSASAATGLRLHGLVSLQFALNGLSSGSPSSTCRTNCTLGRRSVRIFTISLRYDRTRKVR